MIRAIVFDFDGVLAESVDVKTRAFAKLFENEPEDIIQKVIDYHILNGGISRFYKFRYYYEHLLRRPLSREKEKELGEKFSRIVVKSVIEAPWVEGAKETLEFFHHKLPLYVASGTPEEELKQIVEARNMGHFFKGIYGAPEHKSSIIKKVMALNKTTSGQVVMVGDAISDYKAAKATGVFFVGRIRNGNNPFADKKVKTITDLRSLKKIIRI